MGLNPEKKEFLVKTLGEERVGRLEEILPQLSKDLEEAGVGWKELVEVLDPKPELKPDGDEEKEPEGNGDGDSKGGEEPKPDEAVPATVNTKELTAAFKDLLAPISSAIAQLQTDVKELQKSDDEKIAARLGPKTNVDDISKVKRPTDADGNIIPDEMIKSLDKVDSKDDESPTVAAARGIVEDLMLGKRA